VKAKSVAEITLIGIVLVKSIVLARVDADHCRIGQAGTDTGKRERE